jgi:uncharacterized tellurite resistance protein B-like protein
MDDFDKKQQRPLQNLAHLSPDALMEHMQKLTKAPPKGMDVPLATAIVLIEVASSDHIVDRFEKSVIHNGLKAIFRISDQQTTALMAKAKTALGSMRSSSAEASMLKDVLDPASKKQVANLIDTLIRCNGVVDSMEIYLRQRFRALLGLPDEPMPPRSDDY